MKTIRMVYKLLFITIFVLITGNTWASVLSDDIAECSKISDSLQRLVCYDNTARKHRLAGQSDYIQPGAAFLDSQLVVTPWIAEYTLTVRDFANMVSQAVLDSGEKIVVHGWTKKGQDYILNITMRSPIQLHFLPKDTATEEISMSLLKKVFINGDATDAGLFIMAIAAMVPDK